MQSGQRPQAQFLGLGAAHDQYRGAAVGEWARVGRGDPPVDLREPFFHGRVVERGLESGQLLDGAAGADHLVGRHAREGSDLSLESAGLGGLGGLLVAGDRELVELGARETPVRRDEFCAVPLGDEPFWVAAQERFTEWVCPVSDIGQHRYAAHRLHARGDHDVLHTRHHGLCCERDGLLARPALAVHGGGRNGLGEARGEHRIAADVLALLVGLCDVSGDHVVDQGRIDAGLFHQGLEAVGQHVHRVHAVQRTV